MLGAIKYPKNSITKYFCAACFLLTEGLVYMWGQHSLVKNSIICSACKENKTRNLSPDGGVVQPNYKYFVKTATYFLI